MLVLTSPNKWAIDGVSINADYFVLRIKDNEGTMLGLYLDAAEMRAHLAALENGGQ